MFGEHEYWAWFVSKPDFADQEEYFRALRKWSIWTLCVCGPIWLGLVAFAV